MNGQILSPSSVEHEAGIARDFIGLKVLFIMHGKVLL